MIKKSAKRKIWILSMFMLISSTSLAKEKSQITTFIPSVSSEKDLSQEIKFAKAVLKNSGYLRTLQIYQAVREEDLSLCQFEYEKTLANHLLALRYAGENRCSDIESPLFQELCRIVNSQNCEEASGWKKDFCKVTLDNDSSALAQIVNNPDFIKEIGLSIPVDKNNALLALGIYQGFKHYSPLACQRFLKDSSLLLSWKFSCQMLFAQDFEKEMDEVITDLALFVLSRHLKDSNICNRVKDGAVKDSCQNSNIQEVIEFW